MKLRNPFRRLTEDQKLISVIQKKVNDFEFKKPKIQSSAIYNHESKTVTIVTRIPKNI